MGISGVVSNLFYHYQTMLESFGMFATTLGVSGLLLLLGFSIIWLVIAWLWWFAYILESRHTVISALKQVPVLLRGSIWFCIGNVSLIIMVFCLYWLVVILLWGSAVFLLPDLMHKLSGALIPSITIFLVVLAPWSLLGSSFVVCIYDGLQARCKIRQTK